MRMCLIWWRARHEESDGNEKWIKVKREEKRSFSTYLRPFTNDFCLLAHFCHIFDVPEPDCSLARMIIVCCCCCIAAIPAVKWFDRAAQYSYWLCMKDHLAAMNIASKWIFIFQREWKSSQKHAPYKRWIYIRAHRPYQHKSKLFGHHALPRLPQISAVFMLYECLRLGFSSFVDFFLHVLHCLRFQFLFFPLLANIKLCYLVDALSYINDAPWRQCASFKSI